MSELEAPFPRSIPPEASSARPQLPDCTFAYSSTTSLPAPPKPTKTLLPPLPNFAALGRPDLTPADFDPKNVYKSTLAPIKSYRICPKAVCNEHLLNADPSMLAYGNLLRLAEELSYKDIFEKVNAGRPQPVFKSPQEVVNRVTVALKFTAGNNNVTVGRVVRDFDMIRAKNGIFSRRFYKRNKDDADAAVAQ
ncbi:hypothetical protein LTR08_000236 [Meristemomyces frigidus]|nr:hypothetical protein LTR08_000236 [Meristemomyces frigidus]